MQGDVKYGAVQAGPYYGLPQGGPKAPESKTE